MTGVGSWDEKAEFRCKVLDLVKAGRSVPTSPGPGINGQSSCTWGRQDRFDRGLQPA